MRRRSFLKLIGAIAIAPALPVSAAVSAKPALEAGWFMYRGYKFRKDIRLLPVGEVVQIYTQVEINGEPYHNAILVDKEDYEKSINRNMYLDSMVHGINRMKQKLGAA